jgi:hypothetical protein
VQFVHPLCEAQHVHRAERAGLDGLDGIVLLRQGEESRVFGLVRLPLLHGTRAGCLEPVDRKTFQSEDCDLIVWR